MTLYRTVLPRAIINTTNCHDVCAARPPLSRREQRRDIFNGFCAISVAQELPELRRRSLQASQRSSHAPALIRPTAPRLRLQRPRLQTQDRRDDVTLAAAVARRSRARRRAPRVATCWRCALRSGQRSKQGCGAVAPRVRVAPRSPPAPRHSPAPPPPLRVHPSRAAPCRAQSRTPVPRTHGGDVDHAG